MSFESLSYATTGPVTIQAKLNTQDSWQSINRYITDFTFEQKIEDRPFAFREDELRLTFFDYDGGFLTSTWSTTIEDLRVRITFGDNWTIDFYLDLPTTTVKREALGTDTSQKGRLLLTTDIQHWNGLVRDYLYDANPSWVNNRTNLGIILTQIYPRDVSWFDSTSIDTTALNIRNSDNEIFLFIDPVLWDDRPETTVFEFLNQLAHLYDAYVSYNMHTQTLTFMPRFQAEDAPTDWDKIRIQDQTQSNIQWYNGVKYTFTPASDKSALEEQRAIYNAAGEQIILTKNIESREGKEVTGYTAIIGSDGKGDTLTQELWLLPYLRVITQDARYPSPPDPYNFLSDVNGSRYYKRDLINLIIQRSTRYLRPDIIHQYTFQRFLPQLGAYYRFADTVYGYAEQVKYQHKNRTLEARVRKVAS